MSLQKQLMDKIKAAMKSKDKVALQSLRAIKSAILLTKTEIGADSELTEEQEFKILQKQVKQRKDSATIFIKQGRQDLANSELAEVAVIEQFLPEALSEEDIEKIVVANIQNIKASGMKDMGKVMAIVSKELAGKVDGKTLSTLVKNNLM